MKDLTPIIKHFKALLPCANFIVTGSYVLNILDLVEEEPKDLDIILVNPTQESKDILERLMKEQPAKTKPRTGTEVFAIIMHDSVKIDFIVLDGKVKRNTIQLVDFEIDTPRNIFAAKQKCNRLKDWIQLYKISSKIGGLTELNNFVLNNMSPSEDDEY